MVGRQVPWETVAVVVVVAAAAAAAATPPALFAVCAVCKETCLSGFRRGASIRVPTIKQHTVAGIRDCKCTAIVLHAL